MSEKPRSHPATLPVMMLSLPVLLAALSFFSVDSLWGRPLTIQVILAAYICVLALPGSAWMIAGWLVREAPEGPVTKRERLVARVLWVGMTFPMLAWALLTLVAWGEVGPALPDRALYLSSGAFPLGLVVLLALIALSRRRQASGHSSISG